MRMELKRPIRPQNAAAEIARPLARALEKQAELGAAAGLTVTLEAPLENQELKGHLAEEGFVKRLVWLLDELLAPKRPPRILQIEHKAGESNALVITPLSARARAARLEWASRSFDIDGSKSLLAVGRGSVRKRFPGARNDVALEDHLAFVSRDAFTLRWDPARGFWRVESDDAGRAFVEIVRHGSVLLPQLGSIPLETGDVIALTAGPNSDERLELRFVELLDTPGNTEQPA